MTCSQWLPRLFPYADGELDAESRHGLEAHARDCAECRRRIELERAFREIYIAPLRPDEAPPALRLRILAVLEGLARRQGGRRTAVLYRHRRMAAAALAGVLLGAGAWAALGLWSRRDAAVGLQELAHESVHQHQRLTQHIVPYDIEGVSPAEAERWFRTRLDFSVSLPARAGSLLRGGRLTRLPGGDAAGLHYQIGAQDVSLFVLPVTQSRSALIGGELRFHRVTRDGYDVFVWNSKGLTYTLVSEIGERSCLVCHDASDLPGKSERLSRHKAMP